MVDGRSVAASGLRGAVRRVGGFVREAGELGVLGAGEPFPRLRKTRLGLIDRRLGGGQISPARAG